jgi:hypothetical protein
MISLIFTLDYEIYGTGTGDFDSLMIEPTDRLLDVFDRFGAKLTIMAEVAEILAIKKYAEYSTTVRKIEDQLKRAITCGHDVQLHLHPAWFNAHFNDGHWTLDFSEYALVGLEQDKIDSYIRQGKEYLENLLREVDEDYRCVAYRSGNWLIQPSRKVVEVLEKHQICYDSSIFKWGYGQAGNYEIDYTEASSHIFPWRVDPADINRTADRDGLLELPIFSQKVFISSMLTFRRLLLQYRLRRGSRDGGSEQHEPGLGSGRRLGGYKFFVPKKFDFSRLSYREMKQFVASAEKQTRREYGNGKLMPLVAIGHSTEFYESKSIGRFLEHLNELGPDRVQTGTFRTLYESGFGR